MVNLKRMEEQLLLHEGLRLKAYKDTEGLWTIGVGYNADHRGWDALEKTIGRKVSHLPMEDIVLTKEEALAQLRADITRVQDTVRRLFSPTYDTLSEVRQRVIVDMAFNMGRSVLQFKKAKLAVEEGRWSDAYRAMFNSKWASQVGDGPGKKMDRAERLANMMLTGDDYVR